MKGGNVNTFIDHTTFEECAALYKGVKYFFHGLIYDNEKKEYSYVIDAWDSNGNYTPNYVVYNYTVKGKSELLPIPQREIDLCTQFDQNPGWTN